MINIYDNIMKKTIKKRIKKFQRQGSIIFLNIYKKIELNQNSNIKDIKKKKENKRKKNSRPPMLS